MAIFLKASLSLAQTPAKTGLEIFSNKRKISSHVLLFGIKSAQHRSYFLLLLLLEGDVERNPGPTMFTTYTISDRKRTFQSHASEITSESDVSEILSILKENRKIAIANQNFYVYIWAKDGNYASDFLDDGKNGAGKKILELLRRSGTHNVLVVVTRWYGGIHLGKAHFQHILTCAKNPKTGRFCG